MKDFRKLFRPLITILAFGIISCGNKSDDVQIYNGEALGTTYQVKFFSSEKKDISSGLDSIFEVINSSMSTYRENSDISKINKGDSSLVVDKHFREVFKASKKIYEESRGMFDPTVGKLVNAYGFGPEGPKKAMDDEELDSIKEFVGFDKLEITQDGRIKKQHPGIYIDFNAIAKGYAVDEIARYLDNSNITDYLVEVGGELVAKGENLERDQTWAVGIDDPEQKEGERNLQTAVRLKNRAMASSGNYRKFRTDPETGRSYVHTINPRTGLAEESDLLSVSVLAENCTLADGYATAFMALGYHGSLEMLEKLSNVDAYFIYLDKYSEMQIFATPGFEAALIDE